MFISECVQKLKLFSRPLPSLTFHYERLLRQRSLCSGQVSHLWNLMTVLSHLALHFSVLSVLYLARSSSSPSFSVSLFSFLFSFSQPGESVCVCVWAILEHSAQRACTQTWENMSARIQYLPLQHWANGLLSESELKNKPGWLRQEHPFTHHLSIPVSLSVNQIWACPQHVWVHTEKSINHIQYNTV